MNRLKSNPARLPGSRGSIIAHCLHLFPLLLIAMLVAGCGSSSNVRVGTVSAIGVQGQATSIVTGGQLALSANILNDSKGLGIDWTVSCGTPTTTTATAALCGTFSPAHTASGATTNFTAPAVIPTSGMLVITASSTQNPSQSSSITLTMTTTMISVTIDPLSAILAIGGSQNFTATVLNDSANAGVTWAVSCASTVSGACGSVSPSTGTTTNYTAPANVPTGGTVTLTAISITDPSKTASVPITITTLPGALTVTLSQSATSVGTGATTTLTATVLNDPTNAGVTWTVTCSDAGACGAISPAATLSGASSVYTAPATVPSSPIVTITATSVTSPAVFASASIQITTGSSGGGGNGIGVSVTPPTASVNANGSTTLVATVVNDSSNQGVSWTVSCANAGACGTVSPTQTASGATATYMAPLNIPTGGTVTVTAASVTDPSISASAVITVVASGGGSTVTVNVSPLAASVAVNATTSLTASVGNDSANGGVTWTVSCSTNGACGSVAPAQTASGTATTYTAPAAIPAGGTVIVTATSVTDPTVSASATITVTPAGGLITVSVTPPSANVVTGATTPLTATVGNDPANAGVTWTVTCASQGAGACGTVSPTPTASGTATTYTAPAAVPTGGMVTVTATSVTDSSISASAVITVTAPNSNISISLTGSGTTVATGGTITFTAAVSNDSANGGVTWSATCGTAGGCGSFSPATTASNVNTTYTAPANVPTGGTVQITATSVTNPNITSITQITVTGTVVGPPITVTVAPAAATVAINGTESLAATVANDSANAGVTWTVTCSSTATGACGSVNPTQTASGAATTYQAPSAVPSGATVTVTATSVTDPTVSNSSTLTISATGGGVTPISVTVSPSTVSLAEGTTQVFTATVLNDNAGTNEVNWTATCGGSACGSFSQKTTNSTVPTVYTAPSNPGTVTITATSATDNVTTATATVTVTAPPVNISVAITAKPPASVTTSSNVDVTAVITGDTATSPKVDWSATCGSTGTGACGSFSPAQSATGKQTVYIAPATVPKGGTVTIIATSDSDKTKSATATVNVVALIGISITTQPGANLNTSATTTATATVSNDPAKEGVDWIVGTCSSGGNAIDPTTCGSVTSHTASGVAAIYTAPASAPNGLVVSLQASATASENNPLQSVVLVNTSPINVVAPLPVSISITNMPPNTLTAGSKAVSVGATVNNDTGNKGVDWTVSCGSAGACGSFNPAHTASGADTQYTPPAAAPAGGTVTITATSTADTTKTANTTITINAAPITGNALLNGHYAFVVNGQGSSLLQFIAGSLVADGNGNITSGEEDVATGCIGQSICGSATQAPNLAVQFTGTYTIGNDGRGTINISAQGGANSNLGVNGKQTFKVSMISPQHGYIAEFDGSSTAVFTASGTASGTLDQQTTGDFANGFTGNYSFILTGYGTDSQLLAPAGGVMSLNAGKIATDSNSNPLLEVDTLNSAFDFPSDLSGVSLTNIGFSASVDSFGRGTFSLPSADSSINNTPYTFHSYMVDKTHFVLLAADTNYNVAGSGAGFLQPTATPTLSGDYAFTEASYVGNPSAPLSAGGSFSCDSFGNLTGTLDIALVAYKNGQPSLKNANEPVTGNCGTPDGLGRSVIDVTGDTLGGLTQLVSYPTASQGFLLLTTASKISASGSGIAQSQASGTAASTFAGSYAANLQVFDTGSSNFFINNVDVIGQIIVDGISGLTGKADVDQYSYNTGGILTQNAAVSGTFTESAGGRFTGSLNAAPETTNEIFYVVDGSTVLTLRTDGFGGTGVLQLQTF